LTWKKWEKQLFEDSREFILFEQRVYGAKHLLSCQSMVFSNG
jgi:hypothetical protein